MFMCVILNTACAGRQGCRGVNGLQTLEPSQRVAPMPTKLPSPMVHACSIAAWPAPQQPVNYRHQKMQKMSEA